MGIRSAIAVLFCATGLTGSVVAAPLAVGDAIAVDLSDGSGNAAKFNVINTKNGSIAAGSVLKHADGTPVADGVAVKLDNVHNGGGPGDSQTDWGGTNADFYYETKAEDFVFQNPKSPITVTFSGLDNALKYNVRIYALFDDGKGATDTFTVTDGASTKTSVMKRADRKAKATLEEAGGVFNRVSTDGSGNIVASVQVTAGSGWTAYNAVVLEVVSPTANVEITGYDPIADITVKSGDTNKDDVAELGLPSTVTIKGTSDTRAVDSWSASPSYDNDTPGTYTFTATLSSTLPAGYKDDTPETVTVDVIVASSNGIKILDGALSSITSPNNLSGSAMTVMTWIKVDTSAPRGCVLHIKENSAAKSGVAIYITGSTGKIEYWDETNYRDLTNPINGGLVFPRDQWVHLAVTISTTNKSIIYINGVGTDTTRTIAAPVANAPLKLGVTTDGSDPAKDVSYDEVAVFGSELPASQIQAIYASGNGREIASDYANMLLYWRFEDSPQANTAADSDNEADSPGTISGTKGTSFNWVGGKQVGPTITPAIGLQLSLTGTELAWTVAQEVDVKAYQIFADGQLFDTVQAVDADFYSITVPAGAVIEFRVIDKSGFSKSYVPQDGNVKIEIYDLKKGWNLIAVTSDDVNLAPLKQDTVGHVWGWREGRYQSVDSAQATEALWVYATADKTIYLSGKKSEAKITLQAGWNMVGPVENDYIPEKAATVYAWNQVYDAIAGEQKLLIGGKGYWIFSL